MTKKKTISRRAGRFKISRLVMQSYPETIMALMGKMLVLRCEPLAMGDEFEYQALSMLFDEINMGEMTPEYKLYFTTTGMPKILAERVSGRTLH